MTPYDRQTALIVVDVQNDFADPEARCTVAGGADAIPFINGEIAAAATAGAFVVYTQDWHPATTPHFAKDGGIWPVHCVADTWGAELHPDLTSLPDSPRIRKGTSGEDGYSGFYGPRSGNRREIRYQSGGSPRGEPDRQGRCRRTRHGLLRQVHRARCGPLRAGNHPARRRGPRRQSRCRRRRQGRCRHGGGRRDRTMRAMRL